MKKAYNFLLSLASTSPMILIFAVNAQIVILPAMQPCRFYMLIFFCIILINAIGMFSFRFLSKDSIEGRLRDIELANSSFLPSYLGYFFVAVSITRMDTFLLVYGLTVLLVMLSQSMYYNPFLLLFHYNFYHATDENGTRIFLITKKKIRTIQSDGFEKLRRINDVTYIEI